MPFHLSFYRLVVHSLALFFFGCFVLVGNVFAQGWAGPLPSGLPGPSDIGSARQTINGILQTALTYLALVASVVIVIAGVRLIISLGEDEAKEKAKKTILYAVAGLLIILLAKAIVSFVVGLGN